MKLKKTLNRWVFPQVSFSEQSNLCLSVSQLIFLSLCLSFCLSLSPPLSSLPFFSTREMVQPIARGLRAICFLQPLWPPRTPQMDAILGVHWSHPSCPVLLPTEKGLLAPHASSSYTLGSQLIEGTFFICGELMGELVTGKVSFLQLMTYPTDRATSRRPIDFVSKT